MKFTITQASPVLERKSEFQYAVTIWNISGKVVPDCNCQALAKPFDIYVKFNGLEATKQEIYQLTKNKIEDEKIV